MKRNTFLLTLLVAMVQAVIAAVPPGYYSSIDGEDNLTIKARLRDIIAKHTVLGYSSLWEYYPSTYYVGEPKTQVFDLYSNEVRFYDGSSAIPNMNKEHCVPQSWWGGGTSVAQGNDLFNVAPSDATANSKKSNYPLGKCDKVTWTNGVTSIGTATIGNYTGNVFEPFDEYKGDFARIYFYVATAYPDVWVEGKAFAMDKTSDKTLMDWIIPMLLEWSRMDPVDEIEVQRNEDIFNIQGNRNPFIDYPELADYIWGSKSEEFFDLAEHKPNDGTGVAVLQAATPVFSLVGGDAKKPYDVARNTVVTVKGGNSSATLYVSVNDGEWQKCDPKKAGWNSTTQTQIYSPAEWPVTVSDVTSITAYCTMEGRANSDTVTYYYNGVSYDSEFVLYDAFDDITSGNNISTSGSSAPWKGNDNFPTVTKAYQAGGAVKLGTGSASGSITSKPLDFAGGNMTVIISVKGWTNIEGKLSVSVTGAETQTLSYTAKLDDNFEDLTCEFKGVASRPTLTIATTAKRAFIGAVKIPVEKGIDVPVLYGDANADGVINVFDVVAISEYILNGDGDIDKMASDFNKDGEINIYDVVGVSDIILNAE